MLKEEELGKAPISQKYSIRELREISRLTRDPIAQVTLGFLIYDLKTMLHANPDETWENFSSLNPEIDSLENQGAGLLKRSFDIYKSSRKAALYWNGLSQENKEEIQQQIRSNLDIPPSSTISEIKFIEDTCVIFMPQKNVNDSFNYSNSKKGINTTTSIVGFIDPNSFLKDQEGNTCSIIVTSNDDPDTDIDSTIKHEKEHVVFGRYYNRNRFIVSTQTPETLKKQQDNFLKRLKRLEYPHISSLIEKEIADILLNTRISFMDEAIAYGTDGSYSNQLSMDNVLDQFEGYKDGKIEMDYHAGYIRESVDRILDSLDKTDLSESQKINIWWNVEEELIAFTLENKTMSYWLQDLWNKHPNVDKFTSILESIPVSKMWNIGLFIDKNPQDLKAKLESRKEEIYREDVLWSMMIRYMKKNYVNFDKDDLDSKAILDYLRKFHKKLEDSGIDTAMDEADTEQLFKDAANMFIGPDLSIEFYPF